MLQILLTVSIVEKFRNVNKRETAENCGRRFLSSEKITVDTCGHWQQRKKDGRLAFFPRLT
jgi:hypothetical protein